MSKRLKSVLAGIVLTGAASGVAIADGYEPAGNGLTPPPKPSWAGFYTGRHVGVGLQDNRDRRATVNGGGGAAAFASFEDDTIVVGGVQKRA